MISWRMSDFNRNHAVKLINSIYKLSPSGLADGLKAPN
jgi:hypothetical protein